MEDVRRVALELLECERVTLFLLLDRNTLRGKQPRPRQAPCAAAARPGDECLATSLLRPPLLLLLQASCRSQRRA
jgi:hypothetical protein